MKRNFLILGLAVAFLLSAHGVFAQTTPVVSATATTTNCFDYYKFGSVQVSVGSEITKFVPGSTVELTGVIKNENAYPVVDGSVYVKIFKKNSSTVQDAFGPAIVDQFVAVSDVSVPANGSAPVVIKWKVPANVASGDYRLATFFQSAKAFNLLGLSFTNDVIGNTADFSVVGGASDTVAFDHRGVTLNGKPFHFVTPTPTITGDVTIVAPLVNTTKETQTVHVTWNVYSWDALRSSSLITSGQEDVSLKPGENKSSKYVVRDVSAPVYYVVAIAEYKDNKSVLDIRFVRPEVDRARLNFLSTTNYPLRAGEPTTLFACAHDMTQEVSDGGRIVMSAKGPQGNEIYSAIYEGGITGEVMGVKKDFTPTADYENYTLTASLYQKGVLTDTVSLKYDCTKIDPTKCKKPVIAGETPMYLWFVILLVVVLVGVITMFILKKRKVGTLMLLLCATAFGIGGFSTQAYAAPSPAVYSNTYTGDFLSLPLVGGGGWQFKLRNPNVSITYRATINNLTTGLDIVNGSEVEVGDRIHFLFNTPSYDDIFWVGTGFFNDTPYGNWIAGAGTPPNSICRNQNYLFQTVNSVDDYISLSVAPPTKSLTQIGSANLIGCTINADGGKTCTVGSIGTIDVSFNYAPTIARFYHLYLDYASSRGMTGNRVCTTGASSGDSPVPSSMRYNGNNTPSLVITSQTIPVAFTAVPKSNAPAQGVPTLNFYADPSTVGVNQTYSLNWSLSQPMAVEIKPSIWQRVLAYLGFDSEVAQAQVVTSTSDGHFCTGSGGDWPAGGKDTTVNYGSDATESHTAPATAQTLTYTITCNKPAPSPWVVSKSVTVTVGAQMFSCIFVSPTNATMCSGDGSGLEANTPRTVVGSCTSGTKCEYTCDTNYVKEGNTCRLAICENGATDFPACQTGIKSCNPFVTVGNEVQPATFANVNQLVTWKTEAAAGPYSWSTDAAGANVVSTASSYSIKYPTIGTTTLWLKLNGGTRVQCTNTTNGLSDGLPIINNPNFQPF